MSLAWLLHRTTADVSLWSLRSAHYHSEHYSSNPEFYAGPQQPHDSRLYSQLPSELPDVNAFAYSTSSSIPHGSYAELAQESSYAISRFPASSSAPLLHIPPPRARSNTAGLVGRPSSLCEEPLAPAQHGRHFSTDSAFSAYQYRQAPASSAQPLPRHTPGGALLPSLGPLPLPDLLQHNIPGFTISPLTKLPSTYFNYSTSDASARPSARAISEERPARVTASTSQRRAMDINLGPSSRDRTDRPFRCSVCSQSFSRNHDLKRHSVSQYIVWYMA